MKKLAILFIMMFVASSAFAKKDKVNKDAKIDSLSKANAALTSKLDSVSKDLAIYKGVYVAVKEKVMKRDFDPATMSHIIDSLAKGREAAFAGMTSSTAFLRDSIVVLKNEIARMKTLLNGVITVEAANNRLVSELKQLKELLDARIITQTEFESRKTVILNKWQ